jgi:tetratricopeptide (TPR) repeat protein
MGRKKKNGKKREKKRMGKDSAGGGTLKGPGKGFPVNRGRAAVIGFLIFCATFLVYSNTLEGDFIWDDEYLILNNPQIKDIRHLPQIFRTYIGYGSENINNFYRPLQELSNLTDHLIWGEDAFGFHLTNVLLHCAAAVLLFIFLLYVSRSITAAGVAAALFGIHPVNTEAVAYIAGRADPLYSVFLYGSLVLFAGAALRVRRGEPHGPFLAGSLALYTAALLSKELAIVTPGLVFIYCFCFVRGSGLRETWEKLKWSWVPYAGIAGVYALLRLTVLNFADIAPPSIFARIPLVYRLLTFFKTLPIYMRILILPSDLHMERVIRPVRSFFEPAAFMSFAFVLVLAVVAVRSCRKNRLVSFGLLWFFVNLIPVSNIVPVNSFIAEHWIYTASAGLFLIVGAGMAFLMRISAEKAPYARFLIVPAVLVTLGVYGTVTYNRNMDWNNEIAFFHSTLRYHPSNARLHLNLGNTYMEKGKVDKAIEEYQKSLEINSRYAVAYGNIGSAYLRKGDPSKGEAYLKKAVSLRYNYPIAHYNLGIIRYTGGDLGSALKEFSITVEQLPQMYQAWNMIGRVHLRRKEFSRAVEAFERSLSIYPEQKGTVRLLSEARRKLSDKGL